MPVRSSFVSFLLFGSVALSAAACAPEIGDDCASSVDCSPQGDRLCDVTQPEVAAIEFAPGIADTDNWLVLEDLGGETFRTNVSTPGEIIVLGSTEPFAAPQFTLRIGHDAHYHARPTFYGD